MAEPHPTKKPEEAKDGKPGPGKQKCRNCGYPYPHNGDCPAKGKKCNTCNKLNHFATARRSGNSIKALDVNTPADGDSDADDYLFAFKEGQTIDPCNDRGNKLCYDSRFRLLEECHR